MSEDDQAIGAAWVLIHNDLINGFPKEAFQRFKAALLAERQRGEIAHDPDAIMAERKATRDQNDTLFGSAYSMGSAAAFAHCRKGEQKAAPEGWKKAEAEWRSLTERGLDIATYQDASIYKIDQWIDDAEAMLAAAPPPEKQG